METPAGIPVLGDTSDAAAAIEEVGADVIVFAEGAFASSKDMRRAMWELEDLSVQAIVVPSLTDVSSERLKVRPVAGLPLVHLESPRALHASRWAKRVFDVTGALVPAGADRAAHDRDRAWPSSCTTAGRCCSARPGSAVTASRSAA